MISFTHYSRFHTGLQCCDYIVLKKKKKKQYAANQYAAFKILRLYTNGRKTSMDDEASEVEEKQFIPLQIKPNTEYRGP